MSESPGYQRFFAELKRRKVFRVAAVYGATAFVVLQVAELLGEGLELPSVVLRSLIVLLIAGFPIALVLAWAFETTAEGVRRTDPATSGELEAIVAQPVSRNWPSLLLALAGLVALAIGAWLSLSSLTTDAGSGSRAPAEGDGAPEPATADRWAVAVLPFASLTEDEESQAFALGIHDDLLTQLTRIDDLRVTSRTSVMSYLRTNKTAREIAGELGVGTLVEGGVRTAGGRVRLNVQLIDASTDEHLWAETYDRELTAENVFAIQGEIARSVASALEAELSSGEGAVLATARTDNLDAWSAFHRGQRLRDLFGSEESDRAAVGEFRRATELDPGFVAAWAALVHAQAWLIRQGFEADTMDARVSLDRLRELAPDAPETRLATGYYRYYARADFEGALPEFEALRRRSPGNAEAHEYAGYVLRRLGRLDESTTALEQAARLDPRNSTLLWNLGINYRVGRRFDEAARRYGASLELLPESDFARLFWFDTELRGRGNIEAAARIARGAPGFQTEDARALAESWLGLYRRDYDAAIEAVRNVEGELLGFPTRSDSNPRRHRLILMAYAGRAGSEVASTRSWADSLVTLARVELDARPIPPAGDYFGRAAAARSVLGLALALRGDPGDAREAIRYGGEAVRLWALDRDAIDGYATEGILLHIYVLTGRHDEALDLIERLLARPSYLAAGELRLDPIYDAVRGDERFEGLVRRAEGLATER